MRKKFGIIERYAPTLQIAEQILLNIAIMTKTPSDSVKNAAVFFGTVLEKTSSATMEKNLAMNRVNVRHISFICSMDHDVR